MKAKPLVVKEILIIHTWGIGDMILFTPSLNAVHRLYPDIRFTFLVFQPAAAKPIANAAFVREIRYGSTNTLKLFSSIIRLRRKHYDAAMFTSGVNPLKAGLFLFITKAEIKIGEFRKIKFPGLASYTPYDPAKTRTENDYTLLAEIVDIPTWDMVSNHKQDNNLIPSFNLLPPQLDFAEDYYRQKGLMDNFVVCVHPGCLAKNKYRRWPGEYFVRVIQLLKGQYDCAILIIAGPDELDDAKYISDKTGSLLLAGESLENVAAVISRCDFFLNTDSGLGHVAACFNRKSLTVFGPGDERQTAPFSENSRTIRKAISCAPCVHKKHRQCAAACLAELSPQTVFENLMDMIGTGQIKR